MTLTITIGNDHLARRLQSEAQRQGISSAELATKLLDKSLPPDSAATQAGNGDADAHTPVPDTTTIELLAQWDRDDETDDPAEVARQEAELREFMESMNRNRVESEGPRARKIYP